MKVPDISGSLGLSQTSHADGQLQEQEHGPALPPIRTDDMNTTLFRRIYITKHVEPVKTYTEAQQLLEQNDENVRALLFMGWYSLFSHDSDSFNPRLAIEYLQKATPRGTFSHNYHPGGLFRLDSALTQAH